MAKKSSIEKNKRRMRTVAAHKERRAALKKATVDLSLSLEERVAAQNKLTKMSRDGSAVRVRNRCGQTGRPRGYLGFFGVSRIVFRELASAGLLPGVKKASW